MTSKGRTHAGEGEAAAPPTTPARRLSLSAIVELLLARGGRDYSSVTLSRNAKGETQIEVTVRTGDTPDIETVADAQERAAQVYDELVARYPLDDRDDGSSVTISRNAKGETQIEVGAKAGGTGELATLDAAAVEAESIYDRLRLKYPGAGGYTGPDPAKAKP